MTKQPYVVGAYALVCGWGCMCVCGVGWKRGEVVEWARTGEKGGCPDVNRIQNLTGLDHLWRVPQAYFRLRIEDCCLDSPALNHTKEKAALQVLQGHHGGAGQLEEKGVARRGGGCGQQPKPESACTALSFCC